VLVHAATAEDWQARSAAGYVPAGYRAEGFVHLSAAHQLPATLRRYYRGRHDLVLLHLDPAGLVADLVWEDLTGRGERFPHLYGPIALVAVTAARPLTVTPAGEPVPGPGPAAGGDEPAPIRSAAQHRR
jgi:uncharacterized protein (DUF952 family)